MPPKASDKTDALKKRNLQHPHTGQHTHTAPGARCPSGRAARAAPLPLPHARASRYRLSKRTPTEASRIYQAPGPGPPALLPAPAFLSCSCCLQRGSGVLARLGAAGGGGGVLRCAALPPGAPSFLLQRAAWLRRSALLRSAGPVQALLLLLASRPPPPGTPSPITP